MSYDLMVFEASAAPRAGGREAFMQWYDEQAQWGESHGYNDPAIPTMPLKNWFRAMVEDYPPLNGPLAVSDDACDEPNVTDYSLGRSVIYAAFGWSVAEAARRRVVELAAKHGVGFFDVSADNGDVWWPDGKGKLIKGKS
jgi:hypothetical protein